MRYLAKAGALAVVLALIAPNTVLAVDYIKDAAEALKRSPVYVAPGTEGTDNDTAAKLQARLNSNDNIVLVMLPTAAEAELEADISTIATRLSQALGNQRIIGLAVGRNVVGYAPSLPSGVASDQMRRANSVSNNPITALGTFAQNMHIWQREHPQPILPQPTSNGTDLSWLSWLILLVSVGIAGIYLYAKTKSGNKVPEQVRVLLSQIEQTSQQVHNSELRDTLLQICLDIERYYQSSSKGKKRDPLLFKDRLSDINDILEQYIDIQENPRYYPEPEVWLSSGREAIIDFASYVLEKIQSGNEDELANYRLNTYILQAQREVAFPEE